VQDVKKETDVKELFYNNINMKLTYIANRDYGSNTIKNVRLAYERNDNNNCYYVDAKTGEFDCDNLDKVKSMELSKEEVEELVKGSQVSHKKKNKLNVDEAKKLIEKYVNELSKNAKLQEINYRKNNHNGISRERYMGYFYIGEDRNISIDIDAYTGEIIRYRNFDFEGNEKRSSSVKSFEDCYDIAIKAIAKYYPDKLSQIDTKQTCYMDMDQSSNYYFHFNRIVNDIEYNDDHITIEIDANTGEVTRLYNDFNTNITFPSTEKAIGSEKAKEILFNHFKPTLVYIKGENDKKAKLVYILDNKKNEYHWTYNLVDAITGKLINYDGQEQKINEQKQITKHWAKKELEIFQSQNYIDISKIDVNSAINYKELIKLLANIKDYTYRHDRLETKLLFTNIDEKSDMYTYLQFAVEAKIIENKEVKINLDKKVTREELAKIIIKTENLDKVGKLNYIYNVDKLYSDASDIDKDLLGYVALCNGLDIMKGNKGKFNPKKEVTYAEAVVAIYKALVK
jgi:hypothetical protein